MSKFTQNILNIVLFLSILFTSPNSYSLNDVGSREMAWDEGSMFCEVQDELEFDFIAGKDIYWELTNPACIAFVAAWQATTLVAGLASSAACAAPGAAALLITSAAAGVAMSPAMAAYQVKKGVQCGVFLAAQNYASAAACCGGIAAEMIAQGASIGALGLIYGVAKGSHKSARVCGSKWKTWQQLYPNDGDKKSLVYQRSKAGQWKNGNKCNKDSEHKDYKGSYASYLADKYSCGDMEMEIVNKEYREFIYGGIEYEFEGCKNPDWTKRDRKRYLGYNSSNQKYYMKGAAEMPNYACERFNLITNEADRKKGQEAYDCCIKASQRRICIESKNTFGQNYNHKFCELGGAKCKIHDVWYEAYESKNHPGHICAATYSVCPYNHPIGGGTEQIEYIDKYEEGSSNEGKELGTYKKNYCQYLKHCSAIPPIPYSRTSDLDGEYISQACYDLKGDSQNSYNHNEGMLPFNTSHFSAPIAQCFYETFYNLFLNKVGHIECKSPAEIPTADGKCKGGIKQNIGENIKDSEGNVAKSFFAIMQDKLRDIIKLTLTLAVMFVGYSILGSGKNMERKDLLMFIIKLALIMYFALGNAWQQSFFDGVYKTSNFMSNLFMKVDISETQITKITNTYPLAITVKNATNIESGDKIKITEVYGAEGLNNNIFEVDDVNKDNNTFNLINGPSLDKTHDSGAISLLKKLDGCQFPRYDYTKRNDAGEGKYNNPQYPKGKEYLAIWDTLDCKIVWALGLTPNANVPNLFLLILAGFFTGGAGIVFMFATCIFVFFLLSITIRALHIFLLSAISIVLMIYISPVIITLTLFKKTQDIFKKWYKNLFGFILQPVILFAYLGLLITIYDILIIGDVEFNGSANGSPKLLICPYEIAKNSIYCIFSEIGIESSNIKYLGIPIPELDISKVGRIQDIIFTMVKASFLMFIFAEFFTKVSDFAEHLIDSKELKGKSPGAAESLGKGYGALRGIQKRGVRAGTAVAKKAVKSSSNLAKGVARSISNLAK